MSTSAMLGQWGALIVGILAAVSIAVGARIAVRDQAPDTSQQSPRLIRVFAFGAGAFVTAVCLDFMPDAWSAMGDNTAWWLFLGALVLWTANSLSDGWFSKEMRSVDDVSSDDASGSTLGNVLRFTPVSAVVLAAALSFHTFLEGAAVAVSFHELSWNTLAFSVAMILHKLPEGVLWALALISVFSNDKKSVFKILLIPAVCTLLGTILGVLFADTAPPGVLGATSGVIAGAMLYIAFSELIPAIRNVDSPRLSRNWFFIGVIVMFILNEFSRLVGG